MFLADLARNRDGLDLSMFLKFVAGVDRIPLTGFKKNIETFITPADGLLPRSSTCGLVMYVPANVQCSELVYALKEGVGFGNV